MPNYYCCSHNSNTCAYKDTCARYINDGVNTTLFKVACTSDNEHILYIKSDIQTETQELNNVQEEHTKEETIHNAKEMDGNKNEQA